MNNMSYLTTLNNSGWRPSNSSITIFESPNKSVGDFNYDSILSSIENMYNNHLEVKKQIHSMDVQFNAYLAYLKNQEGKKDVIKISLEELQKKTNSLIAAVTTRTSRDDITETDFKIINMLAELANRFNDSIDKALAELCGL